MARAVSVVGMLALLPALSAASPAAGASWEHSLALAEAVLDDDLACEDCEVSLLQTNSEMKKRSVPRSDTLSLPQTSVSDVGHDTVGIHNAIVILVGLFLVIHFIGVVSRLRDVFRGSSKAQAFADRLGSLSPMLPLVCALLVTLRARATELTSRGQPWTYGLPPWWAQASIGVAVGAGVVASVFRMLAMACAPGEGGEAIFGWSHGLLSNFFQGCCALFSGVYFLGVGTILVAEIFMDEPYDVWLNHGRINLSLGLSCMQHIVIQAFVINLVWMVSGNIQDLAANPTQGGAHVIAKAAQAGSLAQTMAPMICLLFAAASMRSWQVKPSGPALEDWEQVFYYLAVNAALVNMVFVICMAAYREARASKLEASTVGSMVLRVLIGAASLAMMVGVFGVLVSILLVQDPSGRKNTPDFSCVVTCMLVMIIQYFGVQIISFLGQLSKQSAGASELGRGARMLVALARAEEANAMCPMLCSLFLAAGMRASEFGASPQGWMQSCMYLCVSAAVLNLLLVIGTSLEAEPHPEEPETGRHKVSPSALFLAFGQVLSLGLVYAGVVAVGYGVVSMKTASLARAR